MVAAAASTAMKYRFLGNTGLLVSQFSFGTMVTIESKTEFEKAYAIIERAFQRGVNFFDSAEIYCDGRSEEALGKIVAVGIERGAWSREDLVISTKLFWGTRRFANVGAKPNSQGLSRKHVVEGIQGSLKRLGLDYVDLLLCHRPDPCTPIEETVRAMNYVIDQGWAFYWGTSEWSARDIIEACEIADRLGLIRPGFDQSQYNIIERSRVELEYDVLYEKYGYGLTTWSPLASGILTGKYLNGIPEDSRLTNVNYFAFSKNNFENYNAKMAALADIAKDLGCSLTQLALAWVSANKHVSTVILGATRLEQLDENLNAVGFVDKITPEVRAKIDDIIQYHFSPPASEEYLLKHRTQWL